MRTEVLDQVGLEEPFTLQQATDALGGDRYAATMTLGQMIKVGLVQCDTTLEWCHTSQRYECTREARYIASHTA